MTLRLAAPLIAMTLLGASCTTATMASDDACVSDACIDASDAGRDGITPIGGDTDTANPADVREDSGAGVNEAGAGVNDAGMDSNPRDSGLGEAYVDPCIDGIDCESGVCLSVALGEAVCTALCSGNDCPPGWGCRAILNSGGDALEVCQPLTERVCEPCEVAADCGALDYICYDQPGSDAGVCLPRCRTDASCPVGHSCRPFEGALGDDTACLPDSLVCSGCLDEDGDGFGIGPDCDGVDDDDENGTVYPGAPELCDGLDNDGDLEVDETFDLQTDVENCGECGVVCAVDGETTACVDGACVLICEPGFADCDGVYENGCETELSSTCSGSCTPDPLEGTPCGVCRDGRNRCGDDGLIVCEGATPPNVCGGCAPIAATLGDACGVCDGVWICSDDDERAECAGGTQNACGVCAESVLGDGERLGDLCGSCGGVYACDSGGAVICDDPGLNSCGGCEELPGVEGEACGCTGEWACTDDGMSCLGDATGLCGVCGSLDVELGSPCGCGGTWACADGDAGVVCEGSPDEEPCVVLDVMVVSDELDVPGYELAVHPLSLESRRYPLRQTSDGLYTTSVPVNRLVDRIELLVQIAVEGTGLADVVEEVWPASAEIWINGTAIEAVGARSDDPRSSSLYIAVTPSGRVTDAGTEPEGPITRGIARNGTRFAVSGYELQPGNTLCLATQGTPGYMSLAFDSTGASPEAHLVFRKPTDVEFAVYEATDAACNDPAGYVRDAWPQGEVSIRVDGFAVEGCVPRRDAPEWSSMRVALGVDGGVLDVGTLTCPPIAPLP